MQTRFGPIHYVEHGGNGPVMLFVHGLGGSLTNWLAVAPRMTDRFRVLAIDLPGFGLTPPGKDFRMRTHRRAVESFISELDQPVVLVGNSTGGLLSEMISADRPDLVTRMILIAPATPPILPDPLLDWPTVFRLVVQATPVVGVAYTRHLLRRYDPQELTRLGLESVTRWPGRVPSEIVDETVSLSRIRRKLPWSAWATNRTATSIALNYMRRSRYREMVKRIVAPTLIIQGLGDHIVSPTAVEWLADLRPDWTLVQMADTGHTPQMDAPLRTLDVMREWLAGEQQAVDDRTTKIG